jgi:hypothetical protein
VRCSSDRLAATLGRQTAGLAQASGYREPSHPYARAEHPAGAAPELDIAG